MGGWYPPEDTAAPDRAFQQRAHVFWECPCARAVVQCVQERVPSACVLPFQVWLVAPPPRVEEGPAWWVLALTALNAMIRTDGAQCRWTSQF